MSAAVAGRSAITICATFSARVIFAKSAAVCAWQAELGQAHAVASGSMPASAAPSRPPPCPLLAEGPAPPSPLPDEDASAAPPDPLVAPRPELPPVPPL